MKKLLFLILITDFSFGQITGKVHSTGAKPVPFANVVLYNNADSSFVAGTYSDEQGTFKIPVPAVGRYFLKYSSIGYKNISSNVFVINDLKDVFDINTVVLAEENNILAEVSVRARKDLIETTPTGKVIHIQSSLMTKGSNALQVLERLPGVITDRRNNQFSLNGQTGVTILFDGRRVQMSMDELMTLLENTVADNIEKIELITSPTAQYDSDGSAGIINIVFKNNPGTGTKINASATAGYGFREKAVMSLGLSSGFKKMVVNAMYSFNHDVGKSGYAGQGTAGSSFMLGETTNTFYGISRRFQNNHNVNLGVQFQPGSKTTFGADLIASFGKSHNLVNNGGTYLPKNSDFFEISVLSDGQTTRQNSFSSVYLNQKFTPNSQLKIDLTHINYANDSPTLINTAYFDENTHPIAPPFPIFTNGNRGTSVSKIRAGILKTDFSTQLNAKINADFGVKISIAENTNNSRVERMVNDEWELDSRSQSRLQSVERIAAAYSQFKFLLSPKATLHLGLRYEYWQRDYNIYDEPLEAGKLFPSILYTQSLNNNNSFSVTYNRRISRPAYTDLISNLFYADPTFVFSGNPLLKPTLTDILKVEFVTKGFITGLSAQYDLHPILRYQITTNESRDIGISSPQNLDYQKSINLFMNYPWQVAKNWKLTLASTSSLRDYKISYSLNPAKKTFVFQNINFSQSISFLRQFEAELSGWYNFPLFEGANSVKGFAVVNLAIGFKLRNEKGVLQLSLPDLLKSFRVNSHNGGMTPIAFNINTTSRWQDETSRFRVIKLTYSRSFGRNTRTVKYDSKDEERERIR